MDDLKLKALYPDEKTYTNQEIVYQLENLRVFAKAAERERQPTGISACILVCELDKFLANFLPPSEYDRMPEATDLAQWNVS